jgi:diacylglycerol kinase
MLQNNSASVYRQALNKTFSTAFNGIRYFFKTERNGKIQLAVAAFTLLFAFYLQVSATDWIFILLCIAAVIGLEMMNSALEHLCNHVHKDYHPSIKIIKDVAAGAVLFVSIVSTIVGLVIFIPKIFSLL